MKVYAASNGEPFAEVVVVDNPSDVGPGWALIKILRKPQNNIVTVNEPDDNGYTRNRGVVVKDIHHKYVMGRLANDALAALKEERDKIAESMVAAREGFDGQQTRLHETEKKLAEAIKKAQEEREDRIQNHQLFVDQRKRADQMEADLGKVRAAIGELRMKEILSGDQVKDVRQGLLGG